MNLPISTEISPASILLGWKALFLMYVPRTLACPFNPRFLTSASFSNINATAPLPTIVPFLLSSNGVAASFNIPFVVPIPIDRNVEPIHSN